VSATPRLFQAEDFCAEWVRNGDAIDVCMWGTAESMSEHVLVTAFNEVRAAANQDPPREIRIDVRAIEFLHSGCLKYLVNWITPLQNRPNEVYKIVIIWNPLMNWQKRTIYVLCSLAPDVLTARNGDDPVRPRPVPSLNPAPAAAAKP
jgi:hypothetical protein